MNNRENNILVFEDTQKIISLSEPLLSSVKESIENSSIYFPLTNDTILPRNNLLVSKYIVNKMTSFMAATDYLLSNRNKRVAVLNFASAKHPGGYVQGGSSAQEEALCRVSTLYNVISDKKFYTEFYQYHRRLNDTLYTDRLIYSPNIKIIKNDYFELFDIPFTVDVITCAAPNLNNRSYDETDSNVPLINDQQLFDIQYNRLMNIIRSAGEHKVDCLILGAFGCGVFKNNPTVVAKAMKKALEDSPYKFEEVIFPIYCRSWETANYEAFYKIFHS